MSQQHHQGGQQQRAQGQVSSGQQSAAAGAQRQAAASQTQTQAKLPDCIIEVRDGVITGVYTRGQDMTWEVMDYDFQDLAPDEVWKAYLAQRASFLDANFNIRRDLFPKAGDKLTPNTIPGMDDSDQPLVGDGATAQAAEIDQVMSLLGGESEGEGT